MVGTRRPAPSREFAAEASFLLALPISPTRLQELTTEAAIRTRPAILFRRSIESPDSEVDLAQSQDFVRHM